MRRLAPIQAVLLLPLPDQDLAPAQEPPAAPPLLAPWSQVVAELLLDQQLGLFFEVDARSRTSLRQEDLLLAAVSLLVADLVAGWW